MKVFVKLWIIKHVNFANRKRWFLFFYRLRHDVKRINANLCSEQNCLTAEVNRLRVFKWLKKKYLGVQSLEVGLSVLNALLEHNQPIILKDLSSKLEMHPAKVHRYLVSLIRMDYAKQLEDGQYALGDQAWRLGLNCIQHSDTLQLVQHLIYDLQSKIGCGIQISKWSPKGPVVVQSIESNHPISIVTKVGSIMPLVNSAAGRLFASYLPEHLFVLY